MTERCNTHDARINTHKWLIGPKIILAISLTEIFLIIISRNHKASHVNDRGHWLGIC